ncbi:RNA 2',3'-cyclic phosphodiesterase [Candidatus Poribacteria bacterium]|nr:RNA 2',3'-cyclic phosphodiesterase [Candidatus Poribacteria bacterium]
MRKPESIRCFIAIEIPKEIQTLILDLQRTLEKEISGATWTKSGKHHLTLKFLGQVEEQQLSSMTNVLSLVAEKNKQFSIEIGGIGVFPNWVHPRVLWLGLTKGESKIRTLSGTINKGLQDLEYPVDTRYHPHLTLARFKKQVTLVENSNSFTQYEILANSDFLVDEFTLVKSELHPNGAIYTPIKNFKLC